MRGVLFRIVEESLGSWIALALSAALFGALHAFNPGATLTSSIAIALEAGVLLAAVFMVTRRLWMVIGLHTAWNFTEGGVFGASVSGGDAHGMLASQFPWFRRADRWRVRAGSVDRRGVDLSRRRCCVPVACVEARAFRAAVLAPRGAAERDAGTRPRCVSKIEDALHRRSRGIEREMPSHVVEPARRQAIP